eukprot:1183305-Prorocentrum_minimum.AAC.3
MRYGNGLGTKPSVATHESESSWDSRTSLSMATGDCSLNPVPHIIPHIAYSATWLAVCGRC